MFLAVEHQETIVVRQGVLREKQWITMNSEYIDLFNNKIAIIKYH